MPSSSWQFTLALLTAIIVFGGGTVAAMVLGREVSPALWAIDGGLANAIVANAAFFGQRATTRDLVAQHANALDLVRTLATPTTTTTTTPGDRTVTTTGPSPPGGQL